MNLIRTFFLTFIIIFSTPFLVFSSQGNVGGSCCYNYDDGSLVVGDLFFEGEYYCDESQSVYLGAANSFSCSQYQPLYVKDSQGICYKYDDGSETSGNYYDGGKPVYASYQNDPSITLIRNFLENEQNLAFKPVGSVIWYEDSLCSTLLTDTPSQNPPQNPGGGNGNENISNNINNFNSYNFSNYDGNQSIPFFPGENIFRPISSYGDVSRNNGSFFEQSTNNCQLSSFEGYFDAQNACNARKSTTGEAQCFYNPTRMSFLLGVLESNSYSSTTELNACQPKYSITSCSQYLNENSCTTNPAYDLDNSYASQHPDLALDCSWISSNQTESFASAYGGICVSKYVKGEENGFSQLDYSQRLNLIKNPSFEQDPINPPWVGVSLEDVSLNKAYLGDESLLLKPGKTVSQLIEGVSLRNYLFSLAVLPTDLSSANLINLDVKVILFDKNGEIKRETLQLKDGLFPSDVGTFSIPFYKTIFFNPFSVPLSTYSLKLEISNLGSQDIFLDAIHLEEISETSVSYYKPVEQIPASASSCELCYVRGSYNTCTEEKSDSLGSCSYMVEDSSQYYGELFEENAFGKDNLFTSDEKKWETQSLSSSRVFCELYQTEDQCVDGNNSVHSTFGSNICSWDSNLGCYKNTYLPQNTQPDHLEMQQLLSDTSLTFEQSCDLFAPNVYIELFGKNSNDDYQKYDDVTQLGHLYMHYQISDYLPLHEACNTIDIDRNIYLSYGVSYIDFNDQYHYVNRTFPLGLRNSTSPVIAGTYPLEQFIVGNPQSSGITVPLRDGVESRYNIFSNKLTSLNITILDQSGNVGYQKIFNTDAFDSSGPLINLTSPEAKKVGISSTYELVDPEILPSNSILSFDVWDNNNVNYCDFSVIGGYESNYSSDWREIDTFVPGVLSSFTIDLARVIMQTPPLGDLFTLRVRCFDSFNQVTINNYNNLYVSFNTDVSSFYPIPFSKDYDTLTQGDILELTTGFLDARINTFYFYTNISDMSCTYQIDGIDQLGTSDSSGVENSSQITGNYLYVINKELTFQEDGLSLVSLSCTSSKGSFSRNYEYIVDTQPPSFTTLSVTDSTLSYSSEGQVYIPLLGNGQKNVFTMDKTKFNIHSYLKTMNFYVSLDGTGSWISDKYGFKTYAYNGINFTENENISLVSYLVHEYEHNTSQSSVFRGNFTLRTPELTTLRNLPFTNSDFVSVSSNLYEFPLSLIAFDKSGNELLIEETFLIDNSTPQIHLTGDVGSIDRDKDLIFVNTLDPVIDLTFNAPEYRTYTCSATVIVGGISYGPWTLDNNVSKSSFTFSLGDITGNPVDVTFQKHSLDLNCVDVYGVEIGVDDFSFVFDNIAPKIEDISFSNGNAFYRYVSNDRATLSQIDDLLTISLEQAESYGAVCSISFISKNQYYNCNSDSIPLSIPSSQSSTISSLALFTEDRKLSRGNTSQCSTTDNFWNGDIPYDVSQVITLDVTCRDFAGNIGSNQTTLFVGHFKSLLADVSFTYDGEKAFPSFLALNNIPSGQVAQFYVVDGGNDIFLKNFTLPELTSGERYTLFPSYINTSWIPGEDRNPIQLKIIFGTESISASIIKDTTAPALTLTVQNLDSFNSLSESSTLIEFSAFDQTSSIKDLIVGIVDLTSNQNIELIYTNITLNSTYTSTKNLPNPEDIETNVILPIFNFLEGKSYGVRIMAVDTIGFISTKQVNFSVINSEILLLGATQSPITPNSYFTNLVDPSLSFSLTTNKSFVCDSGIARGITSQGVQSFEEYGVPISSTYDFVIPSSLNFGTSFNKVIMTFNCAIGNVSKIKTFTLHYDDSLFEINSSSLESNPFGIFYPNNPEIILPIFEDTLRVAFNEPEEFVTCSATLIPDSYYDCATTPLVFNGTGDIARSFNQLFFNSSLGDGGLCIGNDNLDFGSSSTIVTYLDVSITCIDLLDRSDSDMFRVPITYTESSLLGVRPSVEGDNLFITLDALPLDSNFHSFEVVLDGNTYLVSFTEDSFENGIFTYSLDSIDISFLEENKEYSGEILFYYNGVLSDTRYFSFIYDTQAPTLDFRIDSYHVETTVYSKQFDFTVVSVDNGISGLEYLEIIQENDVLFNNKENILNSSSLLLIENSSVGNSFIYSFRYVGSNFDTVLPLTFIVSDSSDNVNISNVVVQYSDDLNMILLDSDSAFAHDSNEYWLSLVEDPVLKIFISQNVLSCRSLGYGTFTSVGDGEFELDLSASSRDVSTLNQFQISCSTDNGILVFTKYLYIVDTLPDFVVTAALDSGFLVSEELGLREFTITSISPGYVEELSCSYSFDGLGEIVLDGGEFLSSHIISLNTSSLISGSYPLVVSCLDQLERSHTSEYFVEVSQDEELSLSNFRFMDSLGQSIILNSDYNRILPNTDYTLFFNANKEQISCTFNIIEKNFFAIVINFFKSLFTNTSQMVFSSESYVFTSDELNLLEEEYTLDIYCTAYGVDNAIEFPLSVSESIMNSSDVSLEYSLIR